MSDIPKLKNPFYILLMITGVIFCITACSYGVMTVKQLDAYAIEKTAAESPLLRAISKHGFTALMIELGVLAATTIAAIATDEYWTKQNAAKTLGEKEEASPDGPSNNTSKDASESVPN